MKKIAFVDFWGTFNPQTFKITEYIKEISDVEITDVNHADYVFYSDHGNKHWFANDHCVKIYFTIENAVPDFNACDFAIGFEWMQYEDRYLRFPLYYLYPKICELMEVKHTHPLSELKTMKTDFCSITISNTNRHPIFKAIVEELSKYKKVDSGGLWQNNMGGRVPDKLAFDKTHKFSIVCENSAHSGYTTEKLVQAFAAGCVPIYWGDPSVSKVFNPKAFINAQDFPSVQELVEYVKKVDSDYALYENYIKEPAIINAIFSKENQIKILKKFLSDIFAQPLEKSYRRNRILWGKIYIETQRRQVSSLSFTLSEKFKKYIWRVKQYFRKKKNSKNQKLVFPALPTSE